VPPLQHQLQHNQISLPKSFATHKKTFFTPKPTTHKQTTSCSELVRHRHHHPQQRFACTSGRAGRQAASRKPQGPPIERTSSQNNDRKLSIVIHKLQH
jgi:hypothetical protein